MYYSSIVLGSEPAWMKMEHCYIHTRIENPQVYFTLAVVTAVIGLTYRAMLPKIKKIKEAEPLNSINSPTLGQSDHRPSVMIG